MAAAEAERRNFFHWPLGFLPIWQRGGFDAVVGNPPYDEITEDAWLKKSPVAGTRNLFSHFIARGASLVRQGGSFGFIVPLSFSCGDRHEKTRRVLYERFGRVTTTHYSIRPAKIFPGVDQRVTIFIASGRPQPKGSTVFSSRLYRFHEHERKDVVLRPSVGLAGQLTQGHIPRVADELGATIYTKLREIPTTLQKCVRDRTDRTTIPWWYHSVGRYWIKACNFAPHFLRDGTEAISADTVQLLADNDHRALGCVALVNSSVFYFWWMTQCDEFHVLKSEVKSLPTPEGVFQDKAILEIAAHLMADYRKKAVRKTIRVGGAVVEMDEIHARLSKDIIWQLDDALAPHYGLTPEEVHYLKNYDIRFRLDDPKSDEPPAQ